MMMHIRSNADAYQIAIVFRSDLHPFIYKNYENLFLGVIFNSVFHVSRTYKKRYRLLHTVPMFKGL